MQKGQQDNDYNKETMKLETVPYRSMDKMRLRTEFQNLSKVEARFMDTSLLRSASLSLWKAFTFSLNSTPLRTRERGIRDTFVLFIQHGFSQKIDLAETEGKQTQMPGAGGAAPLYKPCRTST